MMLKKLSSLLCVLIIVASLTVTCFAQPSADSGTNNGVGTLHYASEDAFASSDRQVYILEIEGNENITEKEQTYMTFVVTDLEGKDLELQLRISKNAEVTIIKTANKMGNRVYSEQHPYISTSRIKLSPDKAEIKVVIDNNTLIIDNITIIKDVTSISDVKVVLSNDSKPETTTQTTSQSPSANSLNDSIDQIDENNSDDDTSSASGVKTVIIVVVTSVILGFIIKLIIGAYQK